jgi:tetratricopeptide (TPR) repeat protein
MKTVKHFLIIFFKRLCRPVFLINKKAYLLLPSGLQKQFNLTNFKFIVLLSVLFSFIISYLLPRSEFKKTLLKTARQPLSLKKHILLSQSFFANGYYNLTKNEIKKAEKLNKIFGFLDFKNENSKLISLTNDLKNKPEEIKKDIEKYKLILKTKPFYKNIYYRLSLNYWQIYQNDKALTFFNKAFYLDPNSSTTKEIEKIIKQ